MYGYGNGFFGMGYMVIMPLVILGILFYMLAVKKEKKELTAQDILDRRFASGGISKEEYEEKTDLLKKTKTL